MDTPHQNFKWKLNTSWEFKVLKQNKINENYENLTKTHGKEIFASGIFNGLCEA